MGKQDNILEIGPEAIYELMLLRLLKDEDLVAPTDWIRQLSRTSLWLEFEEYPDFKALALLFDIIFHIDDLAVLRGQYQASLSEGVVVFLQGTNGADIKFEIKRKSWTDEVFPGQEYYESVRSVVISTVFPDDDTNELKQILLSGEAPASYKELCTNMEKMYQSALSKNTRAREAWKLAKAQMLETHPGLESAFADIFSFSGEHISFSALGELSRTGQIEILKAMGYPLNILADELTLTDAIKKLRHKDTEDLKAARIKWGFRFLGYKRICAVRP